MANLDEYWSQIQQSESFKDLEPDKKERVRQRLFDQYIQTSDSYLTLPQSQRMKVKSHFDEMTAIKPEGLMEGVERKVKPLVKAGKKAIAAAPEMLGKAADAVSGVVDVSKIGSDIQGIAESGQELPGAKAASGAISGTAEKIAGAVEPNFIKPSLTPFDTARAVASGSIRTAGDVLAGIIPETTMGASVFFADPVLKYAGSTFLGKELHLPGWKPKTGLSSEAKGVGADIEKIITKRRIENNSRMMNDGPPKPLEILAHKEEMLKTQDEVSQYEEWLKQADQTSARGGEQPGDLHPEAKTNVSQLRDAAKERLRQLQEEPVRVESLSRSEDELRGYFTRQIDQAKVYMMPEASVPRGTIEQLPEGPKPAGLLEAGEPPKTMPGRSEEPPRVSPPAKPVGPAESYADTGKDVYKNFLVKSFKNRLPGKTKQAIDNLAGALMGSLKDQGMINVKKPLNVDMMNMIDSIVDQAVRVHLEEKKLPRAAQGPAATSEIARLREKGLDSLEVQAEAKRLQSEHEAMRGITDYEDKIRENGGLAMNPADPSGRIPEREEYLRNVPLHLRGTTTPDQMAQALFEASLQEDASTSTMYRKLSERKAAGQPRSAKSFLDEAEYRLENERRKQSGFVNDAPKQPSLPGTPAASMPPSGIKPPEGQVPADELLEGFKNQDIKNQSTFDIVSDVAGHLLDNERGQIGGKDIDPVKQAALEAGVRELVDRAMAMGYQTTQDIMLYAARNAPAEIQDLIRKQLHPTLSAFDDHAYREMDAAKNGNATAKKDMMDMAERGYFQKKADIVRGAYKKFKANQQVVVFKDMDEGLMKLQNDFFVHDNYRKFSKDELAAQRWYLEGKSPKLESLTAQGVKEEDARRWLELAKNPTENMKSARKMTQVFEDEYHDLISEFYDKVGYVEDHVTRRWKQDREYLDWEGRTLGNKPNFLKGRKLLSQADGIDAGYEPVSFDIRDDLRASNHTRVNILSRIHAYQKLGASFGPEGMPAIIDESGDLVTQAKNAKITPHSGEAPASWMRFDHVPLLKGLAINPYFEPAMKFMMARPFQGTVPEVLDFLSASTKATKLYGFFHGYTLGEMTMSGISYRDVFSFGKNRNPLFRGLRYMVKGMTADMDGKSFSKNPVKAMGEFYNSFMTGSGMLANRPLALDMAEHGFKFGSADEDMHGILKKYLVKTEDFLKKRIGEAPAKALTALPRGAIDIQEKALWSYIRPISSMLVYETNLKDSILKFNLEAAEDQKIPVEKIKEMIVNQTSKEMGGISYARLMIQPKTQQVLQWAMLAPGWTIGRALMGAAVLEKGPEGRQARKQMAKLFVGWFFASNMINFNQTKKYLGKGRYMWENPEGYRNQAFLEKDPKGGTKYLQLSKALTEIYDDIDHPMRTMAYKVSAPVQAAAKIMNWATAKAYYPGIEPESPLSAIAHAYQPMITAGNSAYGGLPVKRGPSKNKVEGMLDQYYKGGMKDPALFEEAMQVATEQGYDIGKLDRAVRAARTSKEKRALLQ